MNAELVLPDIPILYTTFAEWMACLLFIVYNKKRFSLPWTVIISIIFLAVIFLGHYIRTLLPIYVWILFMILSAMIMVGFVAIVCKMTFKKSVYKGIHAFIIAEFVAAVEWWLYFYIYIKVPVFKSHIASVAFCAVFYIIIYLILFFLQSRYEDKGSTCRNKSLFSVLMIAIVVFLISNISFIDWTTPMSSKYPLEVAYIRSLVDFCGVVMLYSISEQEKYVNTKMELNCVQNLLDRQYEQYCVTKDTIEIINRKYHDLKHQLALLSSKNSDILNDYIQDIQNEIKPYEMVYKTGNDVVDTILATKMSICLDKKIEFTCVADGKEINFISDVDICSIFGNAMDNAIECVENIREQDKRIIQLSLYRKNDFVIIKFSNCNERGLLYDGNEIVTTKKDKVNHGYGLKSIKSVVEKYSGKIRIDSDLNWFTLWILIPVECESKC